MITWLFDNRNQFGFVPNLVKDFSLRAGTDAWHDLCIKAPYSYEFRFLKYCMLDKVPFRCQLTRSESWEHPAYYPVNLNFFDLDIDFFELMEPHSLELLRQGKFKFLMYYSEGDDVDSTGIDARINELLVKHNISKENFVFVTANRLLDKRGPYVYFPDDELYYRLLHINKKDWIKSVSLGKRKHTFTCLNRADKLWRRIYASKLYSLGLLSKAQFSYTGYQYETPAVNEESTKTWESLDTNLIENLSAFELGIPYKCDNLSDKDHNDHKLIYGPHFMDSYWQFVVETHFDQHTCFITEKTFKCILNLQPFVIVGNYYTLKTLHNLGYKTFNNVINETYDLLLNPVERMQELFSLSYSICQRGDADQIHIMKMIKSVLEYNQQHFLAPKTQRIMSLIKFLDYTK